MADKIDQLTINGTSYDIDLPPDATPTISSVTAVSAYFSQIYGYTGGTACITMYGNYVDLGSYSLNAGSLFTYGTRGNLMLGKIGVGTTGCVNLEVGDDGQSLLIGGSDDHTDYGEVKIPLDSDGTVATQEHVSAYYVPYSGATQGVNLSDNGIIADYYSIGQSICMGHSASLYFIYNGAGEIYLDPYSYVTINGQLRIGGIEGGLYHDTNSDGLVLWNNDGGIYLNGSNTSQHIAIQGDLSYITSAPVISNTTGMLKVVTLPSASASTITFRSGYLYIFY